MATESLVPRFRVRRCFPGVGILSSMYPLSTEEDFTKGTPNLHLAWASNIDAPEDHRHRFTTEFLLYTCR